MFKSLRLILALALALLALNMPIYAQDSDQSKQDLINLVHEQTGNYWQPIIIKKLVSYRLSPAWWAKLLDRNGRGITKTTNLAYAINEYAKRNGWGDVSQIEYRNTGPKEEAKPRVESMVDSWKDKITFAFQADSPSVDSNGANLGLNYMTWVGDFLGNDSWKPSSGIVNMNVVISPGAKDISVAINKSATSFTVTCPQNLAPAEWDHKIARGLKRAGPQI